MKVVISKVLTGISSALAVGIIIVAGMKYNVGTVSAFELFWIITTAIMIILCSALAYLCTFLEDDNEDLQEFCENLIKSLEFDSIIADDEAETVIIPKEEFKFTISEDDNNDIF